MMRVRDLRPTDEATWRALFDAYLDWYGFVIPQTVKDENWRRLMDPASPVYGLAAELDGAMVGIALFVLHPNTSTDKPVCYLEDLYVIPEVRGRGLGRALIQELVDRGRGRWFRVYWMTQAGNGQARALYDKVGDHGDWIRYQVQLDPFPQAAR